MKVNQTFTCLLSFCGVGTINWDFLIDTCAFRYQVMTITLFLLGFVIPFTVIMFCYAAIILRLRKKRPLPSQSSRPFRIIAAVIITFVLCWAPFHITALMEMVLNTNDFLSPLHIRIIITLQITSSLAFINSCLNPLLYVFIGQNYKAEIRKSFLKVMERAFVESSTGTHIYSKSTNVVQSDETEV
uniref:G-protein coupled receptors family 1 profile domain-containing protein n=1 Tax=Tetraodon nigroviridis TaxID=99883 RepID=H3CIF3_TETNG